MGLSFLCTFVFEVLGSLLAGGHGVLSLPAWLDGWVRFGLGRLDYRWLDFIKESADSRRVSWALRNVSSGRVLGGCVAGRGNAIDLASG